jgi:hypothetical protein
MTVGLPSRANSPIDKSKDAGRLCDVGDRMDITEIVESNAAAAVANFNQRANGALDFSERSIVAVEEILSEAAAFIEELTQEKVDIIVKTLGCYLLEVARKQFGGKYAWVSERKQPVLIVGEPCYHIALITWDRARGRLSGDEALNIPFFYQGFAERVRTARPGDHAFYV